MNAPTTKAQITTAHLCGPLGQALAVVDGETWIYENGSRRRPSANDIRFFFDLGLEVRPVDPLGGEPLTEDTLSVLLERETCCFQALHDLLLGMDADLDDALRTRSMRRADHLLADADVAAFVERRFLRPVDKEKWDIAGARRLTGAERLSAAERLYAIVDGPLLLRVEKEIADWLTGQGLTSVERAVEIEKAYDTGLVATLAEIESKIIRAKNITWAMAHVLAIENTRNPAVLPRTQFRPVALSQHRVNLHLASGTRDSLEVMNLMGTQMTFGPNEEIFGEDEPAEYVYKVIKGAVRTCKILSDGRRQIGGFYLPGDIFGLEIGDDHQFSAEAINHASVAMIRRSAVLSLAARDSEAARELWTFTSRELRRVQDHMMLLVKSARQRVACFLLEMSERLAATEAIELPMSRQDIADYLGLTIETVSHTMAQLAHDDAAGVRPRHRAADAAGRDGAANSPTPVGGGAALR